MDIVAVFIADDLHFDMARVDDHFFEIDVGVVEARFSLSASLAENCLTKLIGIIGNPDPFSSSAGDALMKMGNPRRFASFRRLLDILDDAIRSRDDRAFDAFCGRFGFGFVSEKGNGSVGRADEIESAAFANRSKIGIFA